METTDFYTSYQKRPESKQSSANSISKKLSFWWMRDIFKKCLYGTLLESELPKPPPDYTSSDLGDSLMRVWDAEFEAKRARASLKKCIFKCYGFELMKACLISTFGELTFCTLQPFLLGHLISCFSLKEKNDAVPYGLALLACVFGSMLTRRAYNTAIFSLGFKITTSMRSLVYRKALKITAFGKSNPGQILNNLTTDSNELTYTFQFFPYMWIAPLITILLSIFVYSEIGAASAAGASVIALFIPIQAFLGKKFGDFRAKVEDLSDERTNLINELISGVRIVKLFAWEKPLFNVVNEKRRQETNMWTKYFYTCAANEMLTELMPKIALFATIIVYWLLGGRLDARKIFVVTTSFRIIQTQMACWFPCFIQQITSGLVCLQRIQENIIGAETDILQLKYKENIDFSIGAFIKLSNVDAKWAPAQSFPTLKNVNVSLNQSGLTAVVGAVGSGKSSFLSLILNEMIITNGTAKRNGTISYCPQEPWLFPSTIRQNILFGESYDPARYADILRICCLENDVSKLPKGDETPVGENGASLSGGQRARINLARSLYRQADIYILDDPLSAVDSKVGKILFEKAIGEFLASKICILATNQWQYLSAISDVLFVEEGRVSRDSRIISAKLNSTIEEKLEREDAMDIETEETDKSFEDASNHVGSFELLKSYLLSYQSKGNVLLLIFSFLASQSASNWNSLIFSIDFDEEDATDYGSNNSTFLIGFSFLLLVVSVAIRTHTFAKFSLGTASKIYEKLFNSIFRAKMTFFSETSCGKILNRFSDDINTMDEVLPMCLFNSVAAGLAALGILFVTVFVNPWFILPASIVLMMFYLIWKVYTATYRKLYALTDNSKSKLSNHLNSSLEGLAVIRSLNTEHKLWQEFDTHINQMNSSKYLDMCCDRALEFYLECASTVYISCVILYFLFVDQSFDGGDVGLAVSQSIALCELLEWGFMQAAEISGNLVSYRIIMEYCGVPQEDSKWTETSSWPKRGEVTFEKVTLRYGNSEKALSDVSFHVDAGEKVGIVGRTGAGKSSLISTLFRMFDFEGSIIIDGMDTQNIGLHELRSKIAIIPQEPVLFSGTLKNNLDPFDETPDEALVKALSDAELWDEVANLPNGLHSEVAEGGSNFSVGQKQLLCLARALLKKSKIIVLDEATANVDPKTDQAIQSMMRNNFSKCTVLTIAHRLDTVIDSDKILVLDDGKVAEYDHPFKLINNKNSLFRNYVQQAGDSIVKEFSDKAEKMYKKKN